MLFTFCFIIWLVCDSRRPPLESERYPLVKIQDTVYVALDEDIVVNMTRTFGKEINIERYDVRVTRQLGGRREGIAWLADHVQDYKYELVDKNK
jgi:hypothetical protein